MKLKRTWRFLAVLALTVYALIAFAVVAGVAHNLLFAATFIATLGVLVYGLWLLFTGTSRRTVLGWLLLLVGVAAAGMELAYFLSSQRNRRAFLLVILLTIAYWGLAVELRREYWQERRRWHVETGKTANFREPYLIVNPKSGNGRAMKAHIPELAAQQGIRVLVTRKGDDVGAIAEKAVQAGADVLGVSGGDGSIGAVATVAMAHKLPMVVLPGGTRCHFARDVGLEPKHIADALTGFTGIERRVDVATINGRVFVNNASFGLYADIVGHADYRQHKARVSREVLRSIVNGTKHPYALRFRHGRTEFRQAVQVVVGVNRYNTMSLWELGQRESLEGKVLQVTVLSALNDTVARNLLRSVSFEGLRRHGPPASLTQWVGRSFHIAAPRKTMVVGVDGERESYTSPIDIRILPAALRLYVPPEGVRGHLKNPFSLPVVKQALAEVTRRE